MILETMENSIRQITEFNLNSENLDIFTISRVILSNELTINLQKNYVRHSIVRYSTPKGLVIHVIFFKKRRNMRVRFFGRKKEIMTELYQINSTLLQRSLREYARVCKANNLEELIEWWLKHSSETVRLHIWQLFKISLKVPIFFNEIKQ